MRKLEDEQKEIDGMMKQSHDVLVWFNNMNNGPSTLRWTKKIRCEDKK